MAIRLGLIPVLACFVCGPWLTAPALAGDPDAVAFDQQFRDDSSDVASLDDLYESLLAFRLCDLGRKKLTDTKNRFDGVTRTLLAADSYLHNPPAGVDKKTLADLAAAARKLIQRRKALEDFVTGPACGGREFVAPVEPDPTPTDDLASGPTISGEPARAESADPCGLFPVDVRVQRLGPPAAAIEEWNRTKDKLLAKLTACGNNGGCLVARSADARQHMEKLGPLTLQLLATYDSVCGQLSDLAAFSPQVQGLVAHRPASGPYAKQAGAGPSTVSPPPSDQAPAAPGAGGVSEPGDGGLQSPGPRKPGGVAVGPPTTSPPAAQGEGPASPPASPPDAPPDGDAPAEGVPGKDKPAEATPPPSPKPVATATREKAPASPADTPPPGGAGRRNPTAPGAPEPANSDDGTVMLVPPPTVGRDYLDGSLCGPDVSDNVVGVLNRIIEDFKKLGSEERVDACLELVGINTGGDAWDIDRLFFDKDETPWTSTYPPCGRPMEACSRTVEFMGTCQHAQVVNYVQWGTMKQLCDGGSGFAGVMDNLHRLRNLGKSIAGAILEHRNVGVPTEAQMNMVRFGEDYTGARRSGTVNMDLLRRGVQARARADGRPEAVCKLSCRLPPKLQSVFNDMRWNYKWLPFHKDQP